MVSFSPCRGVYVDGNLLESRGRRELKFKVRVGPVVHLGRWSERWHGKLLSQASCLWEIESGGVVPAIWPSQPLGQGWGRSSQVSFIATGNVPRASYFLARSLGMRPASSGPSVVFSPLNLALSSPHEFFGLYLWRFSW